MAGQYLTAVFEMRPTRRKAAILERVRAETEVAFWTALEGGQKKADAIADEKDRSKRTIEIRAMAHKGMGQAQRAGLVECVRHALARDVRMAITSYVELKRGDLKPEWPLPRSSVRTNYEAALDDLSASIAKDDEDLARDEMSRSNRDALPRPFTLARARDARIIRKGPEGALSVVLNILSARDIKAKVAKIDEGIDATTGQIFKASSAKTKIIVPLSCSKWHEHRFLNGRAILRSSIILKKDDRWFMQAQFEMPEKKLDVSDKKIGVERGIVNPVAVSVVGSNGQIVEATEPKGKEIGIAIRESENKRRDEQRRRGRTSRRYLRAVDNNLHILANEIVKTAKRHRAPVVIENLDSFKTTITQKRQKGTRRGGWRRTLKRAQLGKLETMLEYKLNLAGLPKLEKVFPAGTSITCPVCGTRDGKSRKSQESFICVSCQFELNADSVGAINIARRDVAMRNIKKGAKLEPIEKNMVEALRGLDDGGLGPLANSGECFVAGRVSADNANDQLAGTTLPAGQKS